MTKVKNIKPSFPLTSISIKNFKGIKTLKLNGLPDDANWIFLTGENGYGKTSVLQGIALVLGGGEEHTYKYFSEQKNLAIDCTIRELHRINVFSFGGSSAHSASIDIDPSLFIEKLCCYGSSRLDMASENSKQEKSPTKSLFDSSVLLQNIEYQISRWYFKQEDFPEYKEKYKSVTALLIKLLGVSKITVDKNDVVWYYEKDKEENAYNALTSNELAAGYRSLISMIGDMILRLFKTQPDIHNPADLEGIVIIDELDLHLHPKWQKRLPSLLSDIFPKIQFIASTHSPIPLLGAPKGSVFLRVNRSAKEGITVERLVEMEKEISNLLPNAILTSPIFGMTEIFPISHDSKEGIRTEDFYAEIKINDLINKRLDDFLTKEKEQELLDLFKSKNEEEK